MVFGVRCKALQGVRCEATPVGAGAPRHPLLDGARGGEEPELWQEGGRLVHGHPRHRDAGGAITKPTIPFNHKIQQNTIDHKVEK